VSELTALQQEAITMTVYRGYSFREASEILGIPLPTLKTRVRGGLIALRRTPTAMAL
jgi:RNA polymerase sigma-70 factor (ECF subfamily)